MTLYRNSIHFMRRIDPKEVKTRDLHQYLLGSVAPRPIAFVSTLDENGIANLAPYSFFNCFSSNPPILVFSSNRRVVDNTTKDTLRNIKITGEAVINVVNYDIVRQMAVASIQFPTGISEFKKSGLTPIESEMVKAPRVKESPAQMECKVKEVITLGEHGGAGHLIICEMVLMHINENVLDGDRINPHKMDLMGRMGRAYYCRASGDAIQTIVQAVTEISIGYDALPSSIQDSNVLTGNDIGVFAGMIRIPNKDELMEIVLNDPLFSSDMSKEEVHGYAHEMIAKGEYEYAFKVALLGDYEY
jgi:flavin reductase (DIM6/NTAB) family NADH-FMN oxidoreductase RutF